MSIDRYPLSTEIPPFAISALEAEIAQQRAVISLLEADGHETTDARKQLAHLLVRLSVAARSKAPGPSSRVAAGPNGID